MKPTLIALAGAAILGSGAFAATIHVDATAPLGGDGLGWTTAHTFLQDALAAAAPGDEIRVAAGTYRPDRSTTNPTGSGLRSASFTLLDDVTILGGYAGSTGGDPDARDTVATPTVLSGDLAADDGPDFANNGENALHVIVANNLSATARLDGVTVIGGNANTSSNDRFGGGAVALFSSAGFSNVRFIRNRALFGAGVYTSSNGSPTFTDCLFLENDATQQGGGAYANTVGGATFISCMFLGNACVNTGGGLYARAVTTAVNSIFSGNSASGGGGVNTIAGTATITNCSFSNNTASSSGPAINAQSGGGTATVTVNNCIIWNHTTSIGLAGGLVTVNRSIVEGGWTGAGSGNFDVNPDYNDADGADDVSGNDDDDLRVMLGSPAIDAGDNASVPAGVTTDLDGGPRFVAALSPTPLVDIGAYERTANEPPTADIVFEQLTEVGVEAEVALDGTGSTDPNSVTPDLEFRWIIDGVEVCAGDFLTCGRIEVLLGFGAHDIELTVTDPQGASNTTMTNIVLDPAQLSVFSPRNAGVEFSDKATVQIVGEVVLPSGLNYTEVTPFALLEVAVAGQNILPIVPTPVIFDVNGTKWTFDDLPATGIDRFQINWTQSRLRYRHENRLVRIRSELISSTESVLTVSFKRNAIGGPFTLDIDGVATVDVDAAGMPTGNVDIDNDRPGKEFTITVPFAVAESSTITLSGCVTATIDVVDHFVPSVGRFRIVAGSAEGLFPDGADTTPRTLDAFLMLGASGYPGSISLGPDDLNAQSSIWRFNR